MSDESTSLAATPAAPFPWRRLGLTAVGLCLLCAGLGAEPSASAGEPVMGYIVDGALRVSGPDPWWGYRSPCPSLSTWPRGMDREEAWQQRVRCREELLLTARRPERSEEVALILTELAGAYSGESPERGLDLLDEALGWATRRTARNADWSRCGASSVVADSRGLRGALPGAPGPGEGPSLSRLRSAPGSG